MPSVAERCMAISELSFAVLQKRAEDATPEQAVAAVRRYLELRYPALAGALQISAGVGGVVLRAEGEAPWELVGEAVERLRRPDLEEAAGEIEVDAEEFAIAPSDLPQEAAPDEREIISSEVRYFPYPDCEWFEIRHGRLMLTDRKIVFEPRLVVAENPDAEMAARHVIPLAAIQKAYRGEWWTVPCLMLQTADMTYRYGWPAERGEPSLIFDVDEWMLHIRSLVRNPE